MNKVDLRNKVAVVTGAGRGIGKAIASAIAERGATVILAARSMAALEATAAEITEASGKAEAKQLNVSREESVAAFFKEVATQHGKLDILVNNAGINLQKPFMEATAEELDAMHVVNVRGVFLCCREAMRIMIPQQSGYIINIASVLALKGYVDQAGYAASKHAVYGLTKSLAIEAQKYNIRVSVVHPGATGTEMAIKARPDLNPQEMVQPEDVAQAVMYLLGLSDTCAVDQIYIRRKKGAPFQ